MIVYDDRLDRIRHHKRARPGARRKRPISEQERRRQAYTLNLPKRFGPKNCRPRSLWFFDIHRTRWRHSRFPAVWRLPRAQKFRSKSMGDQRGV